MSSQAVGNVSIFSKCHPSVAIEAVGTFLNKRIVKLALSALVIGAGAFLASSMLGVGLAVAGVGLAFFVYQIRGHYKEREAMRRQIQHGQIVQFESPQLNSGSAAASSSSSSASVASGVSAAAALLQQVDQMPAVPVVEEEQPEVAAGQSSASAEAVVAEEQQPAAPVVEEEQPEVAAGQSSASAEAVAAEEQQPAAPVVEEEPAASVVEEQIQTPQDSASSSSSAPVEKKPLSPSKRKDQGPRHRYGRTAARRVMNGYASQLLSLSQQKSSLRSVSAWQKKPVIKK